MSIAKYRASRATDDSGQPVHYHRVHLDGAPFRGNISHLLRENEYQEQKEIEYETKVQVFRLWVPEDLKAYAAVLDMIANRACKLWYRQHLPVPSENSFSVLVEWSERYVTLNPMRASRPLPRA